MLTLSRKVGEKIEIGEDVVITVQRISGHHTVRLAIDAPDDVTILRSELLAAVNEERKTDEDVSTLRSSI